MGNFQLHAGASVSGFGDFTNTSTAGLINNGSLYIMGNISNDQASMSAASGTLYLNGNSLQSLNGSQPFKTYNLQTNNNSGIMLNANLSVAGLHTFTAGLISTSVTPYHLVYESGSSHTGSNDSRHVTGWVKKMGNTNFTFPVGDLTYHRPIAISNLSAVSEINGHYFTPSQHTTSLAPPLVMVKASEYWELDKISGGTAQITVNWDHSKVHMDNVLLSDIRVAQYTGSNWTDAGGTASGNTTATGTITSSALSSFGAITLGYHSIPLPLKIISFTAERRSGSSFLHWISENEENVDRFDVQRSDDARTYKTIGMVAARNSPFTQHYDFEDPSALQGITYYRVKAVDLDGKFMYTKIVAVTETQVSPVSFYVLNPVRSVITIFNKTGWDGLFEYRLFNAGGRLVLKGNTIMGANGSAVLPLPSQSAAGVYMLEISNSRTHFTQKILVEK